ASPPSTASAAVGPRRRPRAPAARTAKRFAHDPPGTSGRGVAPQRRCRLAGAVQDSARMSEDGRLAKPEAGARPSVPAVGRAAIGGLVSAAVGAGAERGGSLVPGADLGERDPVYLTASPPATSE